MERIRNKANHKVIKTVKDASEYIATGEWELLEKNTSKKANVDVNAPV